MAEIKLTCIKHLSSNSTNSIYMFLIICCYSEFFISSYYSSITFRFINMYLAWNMKLTYIIKQIMMAIIHWIIIHVNFSIIVQELFLRTTRPHFSWTAAIEFMTRLSVGPQHSNARLLCPCTGLALSYKNLNSCF